MKKSVPTMYARDMFMPVGNKLPANLVLDPNSNRIASVMNFLYNLTDSQLEELGNEAAKKAGCEKLELWFYTLTEGSRECPTKCDLNQVDFSKIVEIRFDGSTSPYLNTDRTSTDYISVVLVLSE